MIEVIQFCIDEAKSSGVSYFCTKLNEVLNATGEVRSAVVRSVEELEGFLDVGLRRRRTAELRTSNIILHLHGIWKRPQHLAARWAKAHGVPIVWSTHGMTAPWSMRHKWWKKLPAWWLYQKRDLKSAKVIHCTTETEAEWNRKLLVAGCQWLVAGRGSKTNNQQPTTNNYFVVAPLGCGERVASCQSLVVRGERKTNNQQLTTNNFFTVLFVGRVHPVKGLENLIRAAKQVAQVHFRIVGPDEGGYLRTLETLCEKLGVTNVEFVGERRGEELSAEYEGCDVLVLPSFTENFGGVVVDALAHGKPVIASKATPWRELECAKVSGAVRGDQVESERTNWQLLSERDPLTLSESERRSIVERIEETEEIVVRQPEDVQLRRLVKGYWDGDARIIKEIVDWGKSIVPERVENDFIGEIQTHKNALRSILFHTRFRGPLKVLVLQHLEQILRHAVLFNKGRDGDEVFYNLAHRMRFEMGRGEGAKEFVVRLIVKETAEGNRTWTVEFSNKKELTGVPTTGEAATVAVTHLTPPSTHTILKLIYAVNAGACGRCGWWVENDPETLAKTIREASELPRKTLQEMGENGKELVKAKYTWEAVAKTMCRCYREVIGE